MSTSTELNRVHRHAFVADQGFAPGDFPRLMGPRACCWHYPHSGTRDTFTTGPYEAGREGLEPPIRSLVVPPGIKPGSEV